MAKQCQQCGDLLWHDGGICNRCCVQIRLKALNAEGVAPGILSQIEGDTETVVGMRANDALGHLCSDAACSRMRQPGSLFCGPCTRALLNNRAPARLLETWPGKKANEGGPERKDARYMAGRLWEALFVFMIVVLALAVWPR